MILTTSELIATLQQEVRILLHPAGKVERSMPGYRPAPKVFDRSTLGATWSPAEAEAKELERSLLRLHRRECEDVHRI